MWNRGPGEDMANLSIAWREISGLPASPDCRYGVGIIRDLIPQRARWFRTPRLQDPRSYNSALIQKNFVRPQKMSGV